MLLLLSSWDEQGVGGYAFFGGHESFFSHLPRLRVIIFIFRIFVFVFLGGGILQEVATFVYM